MLPLPEVRFSLFRLSVRLFLLAAAAAALSGQDQSAPQPAPQPAQQSAQQPGSADRSAPATRAGEIDRQRQAKAAHLLPEVQSKAEHDFAVVENDSIVQRIFGGVSGLRLRLGGLITGSGLALGPEYDHPLFDDQAQFMASVRGSLEKYYLMETGLSMPKLAHDHYFFDVYGVHRDYPSVDYYGPGPDSHKAGRADFRLEDTWFQATTGIKLWNHLRLGGVARYLLVNVGPGDDAEYTSAETLYPATPGMLYQSNFLQDGGFLQFDYRDVPGDPHSGGNYIAQFSTYNDVRRDRYSFDRLDLEAQQYIGFFNKLRVIALRAKIVATSPHAGNQVPFYLQPTLGGPDDLRGYRAFRFYDNNEAVLNGEYRWQVFAGLDMALFVDAGQVFDRWQQINYRHLRSDAGFGFRFKMNGAVFMRIDTGFSPEGFGIWLKFGNIF